MSKAMVTNEPKASHRNVISVEMVAKGFGLQSQW